MKLASFRSKHGPSWGVVENDSIADTGAVLGERFPDLRSVIAAGAYGQARDAAARAPRIGLADVAWLPVIPNPGKILCIGLNYESHRVETGRPERDNPTIFVRFADSQIGHGEGIVKPRVSDALDYEGELAVIIGTGGRAIARDKALNHVAGYACYNDASVRDWQNHTTQFTPGKNFPATGSFGPWMVTADDIPDYTALRLTTRVNGAVVQDAGLDQLIFPIPRLIDYISRFTSLSPGDVIITGTPGGVGFKRTPPLFLKDGDVVEVDIPRVGLLRNPVVGEAT